LDRYLRIRQDDPEVRARIARLADRAATSALRKLNAMELYRDAWDAAPEKFDLGIRQAELAIELNRFEPALSAARRLSEAKGVSLQDKPVAQSQGARIKALSLLGRSNLPDVVVPENEWKDIVAAFQDAIARNPSDLDLPVRLAEIDR